jgi:hypothetical protein
MRHVPKRQMVGTPAAELKLAPAGSRGNPRRTPTMIQLRYVPPTLAATAVLLLSSLSSAVAARPIDPGCGDGPACAYGYECTVVGGSGCSQPACAPGEACPEPEPCVVTEEMGCTPAHCTADAECAAGMVCHAWEQPCPVTDCACAPDVPDCGCGTTTCEPTHVSMCTPRYLLPCAADADCGAGFTCQEQMTGCATAGSSGGSEPAPGAAPIPADGSAGAASDPIEPAPECSPEPSGVFQCVVKEIACAGAAECPAGWTCEQESYPTAGPCAPNTDCAAEPIPMPVSSVCRPPYYGVDSSGGLETPTTPVSQGTGTGQGTIGGESGTPSPEPNDAEDGSSHDSAACQMGHAQASSGIVSLLAMLGALLGLKRRRRAHG